MLPKVINKNEQNEGRNIMTKATITKRLVALLATMILVVGMIVPAIAAPSQPNTGTITVHKYVRSTPGIADSDNIFSGEQLSAAKEAALGNPLKNAGFTLYEIDMTNVNAAIANGNTLVSHDVDTTNPMPEVTFTLDGAGTPPVTTITATTTVKFPEELTDPAGIIQFGNDDIDDGYYLLVETNNPDPVKYTPANPSVIKLPLTLTDGSDHNRNIHVYPKNIDNSAAIVNKTIGGTMAPLEVDDVVPFKISTTFKNNALLPADRVDQASDLRDGAVYGTVKVTDDLEGYFTWVDTASAPIPGTKGLEVYLVNGAGMPIIGGDLVLGVDYNLISGTVDTAGTKIEIELTSVGIDEAISKNASALVMEFDAIYTGIGVTVQPGITNLPVTNDAEVVIRKQGSTNPPIIPPGVLNLPKANIVVNKTFTSLLAPNLDDAVFTLARGTGVTIVYDHTGGTTYTVTELATLATEYVCGSNGLPVFGVTDGNGNIIFNNVPYTDAGATYYLRELETKGGYALPNGHIKVTLDSKADLILANSSLLDNGEWKNGAIVEPVVTIHNDLLADATKDFSLPLTGGAGTMMFTIGGIVIMLGAAILIIKNKKKSKTL